MDRLAAAGISHDEVVVLLEIEGLAEFEESWSALMTDVQRRLKG